jgi:hypothetical protein
MRIAPLRPALNPGFGMIRNECAPIGTHNCRSNQNPIAIQKIPKMRLQRGWHRRCKPMFDY